MTDKQNRNDIGDQIRDAVQGALASGDFAELNKVVAGSVSGALSEAKRQVAAGVNQAMNYAQRQQATQPSGQHPAQAPRKQKRSQLPVIKIKQVGKVPGILFMVFGGIGLGLSCIGTLVALIVSMAGGEFQPLLVAGMFLAGFAYMIERGCMRRSRLKRAERYVQLCGSKSYIDIEDLALHTGKSKRYVLKDVKKMIKLGIFPEGHLDAQESCLILNDATFREYLQLQKERKAFEMEQKVARMQEKQKASGQYILQHPEPVQAAEEQQPESDNPELDALIREGNDCIRRLREMNDAIEGEVISAKLYKLENLLKEIFARVQEHPEQMPQMRKFMNYYLPTTLKLVEAYAEFDEVSVPGEDITSAKAEIEKTLDTINQAFAELLNKLFRESVYDVTADAQVLQTMLANEGLAGNGKFEKLSNRQESE